jgi:hypothetical protein
MIVAAMRERAQKGELRASQRQAWQVLANRHTMRRGGDRSKLTSHCARRVRLQVPCFVLRGTARLEEIDNRPGPGRGTLRLGLGLRAEQLRQSYSKEAQAPKAQEAPSRKGAVPR